MLIWTRSFFVFIIFHSKLQLTQLLVVNSFKSSLRLKLLSLSCKVLIITYILWVNKSQTWNVLLIVKLKCCIWNQWDLYPRNHIFKIINTNLKDYKCISYNNQFQWKTHFYDFCLPVLENYILYLFGLARFRH